MKVSGVYYIKNLRNGKVYIGSAMDIDKRWRDHKGLLVRNKHHSIHLQRAWNIDGASSFEFSIIEECSVGAVKNQKRCQKR